MAGSCGQNLQVNLKIDKPVVDNRAHLLYSNGNR